MNPQEVVNKITNLNKQINENNEKAKRSKWSSDQIKNELQDKIDAYNKENGTQITLENPNSIVDEANKVLRNKVEEQALLSKALELINQKEFDKVEKLLNIEVQGNAKIEIDKDIVNIEELEENVNIALENFKFNDESASNEDDATVIEDVKVENQTLFDPLASIKQEQATEEELTIEEKPAENESTSIGLEGLDLSSISINTESTEEPVISNDGIIKEEPNLDLDIDTDSNQETYSNVIDRITDGKGLGVKEETVVEKEEPKTTEENLSGIDLNISDEVVKGDSEQAKDLLGSIGGSSGISDLVL